MRGAFNVTGDPTKGECRPGPYESGDATKSYRNPGVDHPTVENRTPEFATTQIHTVDGLQHLGRIEREDDERVILRTSNSFAGPLEILKEDIEERGLSPLSSMPVGLLNTWELDQIADLLAYLIGSDPQAEPPGESP